MLPGILILVGYIVARKTKFLVKDELREYKKYFSLFQKILQVLLTVSLLPYTLAFALLFPLEKRKNLFVTVSLLMCVFYNAFFTNEVLFVSSLAYSITLGWLKDIRFKEFIKP